MRKHGISFLFLALLTVIGLMSCNKKKITNREEWVASINKPENGVNKTERVGAIKAALSFRPWQLMMPKGYKGENKTQNGDPYKLKDKLFFVLSLSANNKELLRQLPFAQYSEMVQVLAFRMNDYVQAYPDDREPVQPLECIFQQTYGMGVANNLVIVFNKKKLLDADKIKIKIKEFGLNTGDLDFDLKTDDIKQIDNVSLN